MSDKKLLIKAVTFGSVSGLLASVVLMCITAVVILTSGLLPSNLTDYITLALLCAGTVFGGFVTARITKSAGLIVGMITGLCIFVFVTIFGLIKGSDSVSILLLLRFVFTIVCGGIGGILGVNKKEKLHIK